MKNINEILTGLGIQIPEEKQADFDKQFAENYKTIADYDRWPPLFSSKNR